MLKNLSKYNVLILVNVRWWNATAFYAINIARILKENKHKVIVGCNKNYPAYSMAKKYGLDVIDLNFYGYNIFEDHTFAFLAKLFTKVKFI